MAWEVLMKKGKKATAEYLQRECSGTHQQHNSLLHNLLDNLLNPVHRINDTENIDWCWWLIAGGRTPEEFKNLVMKCDNTTKCGKVYKPKFVIHRCWTCGLNPCVALCVDCFKEGNHEGHNSMILQSDTGGVCDCGDSAIMKKSGFCQRHGPKADSSKPAAPPDLVCVAEAMMPRILLRLLHHYRDGYVYDNVESCRETDQEAEAYIDMLQCLGNSGHVVRSVITEALTNPRVYKEATDSGTDSGSYSAYKQQSHMNYLNAIKNFTDFSPATETQERARPMLKHETFLEEFMFWMTTSEFPPHLTQFLLNLLADFNFKVEFSRGFILHYSRMALLLCKTKNRETLSNRCVQVSVQLLTNEKISEKMAEEMDLMEIIIASLTGIMQNILIPDALHDHGCTHHQVVDCNHHVMENHCYAPLASDLSSTWHHPPVALQFMSNSRLIGMWFNFLRYFQGMNTNHRELEQHVEVEPNNYVAAVCAELEISARPMWNLLSHLKTPDTLPHTLLVLRHCSIALQKWFQDINCASVDILNSKKVSFHLPLHRYYALCMSQAVRLQNAKLEEVLPSKELLELMMVHMFQLQIAFHEIVNGLWVRNGLQIMGQEYWQSDSCNATVDADLFLLQIGAAHLDPDKFLTTLWSGFHLMPSLSLSGTLCSQPDEKCKMLESCLTMMALIVTSRNNLGLTDDDVARLEMITQLCIADRTHSQLINLIPERCGGVGVAAKNFEPDLEEVADYHAPSTILPGMYSPKENVWRDMYDPVHVLLRVMDRQYYQASLDRFNNYARSAGDYSLRSAPWPPFRIPPEVSHPFKDPSKVLHCQTFLSIMFVLLYKILRDPNMPEALLALVIYLLELALNHKSSGVESKEESSEEAEMGTTGRSRKLSGVVEDLQLDQWFPSDGLHANLRHTITVVNLTENHEMEETSESSLLHSVEPMDSSDEVHMETTSSTSGSSNVVEVNESVISMLLKLHSRLTSRPDSYSPPGEECSPRDRHSRIGDGAHFIRNLLDRISEMDVENKPFIRQTREMIWPKPDDKNSQQKDERTRRQHKDELMKRAKHRQEKMMAMFAWKAKRFMKKAESDSAADGSSSMNDDDTQEYNCVICGHTTSNTESNPLGRVVLLQASNILSHGCRNPENLIVPTNEEEIHKLKGTRKKSHQVEEKVTHLQKLFNQATAFHPGWERGLSVKTCGHYFHLSCQKSYQQSLVGDNSARDYLEPEKGEFCCPLCRQLSNTVIPISTGEAVARDAQPEAATLRQIATKVGELLEKERVPPTENAIVMARMDVMDAALKVMNRSSAVSSSPFLASCMARTNLELEVAQNCGTLLGGCLPSTSARAVFGPFLHVLALHTQSSPSFTRLWSHVTGLSRKLDDGEVPLLVRDMASLLLQLTLCLPLDMDAALYTGIVKALFSVVFVQASCIYTCSLSKKQKTRCKRERKNRSLMGEIIVALEHTEFYSESVSDVRVEGAEQALKRMCLPFVRIAALLCCHLHDRDLPVIASEEEEFAKLSEYLSMKGRTPTECVEWCVENPSELVRSWCLEYQRVVRRNKNAAKNLLVHHFITFSSPKLLKLPKNYDTIFQFYTGRMCERCNTPPKFLSICLICGTAVCFKESCCSQDDVYEAVRHSMSCGYGTCVYLVVNSCIVVVIRGERTCLWGSLYLDSYGDEDRDLERGKPLFLSEERYALLQEQWLHHRFDHTNKSWVWHKNSL